MEFHIDNETESEDVMARIFNPELGLHVTIITAPESTLKEDGPVVTQITDSDIYVLYSDEFVERKIETAFEKNREDLGEMMAFSVGVSFLISQAILAAETKFQENSKQ